MAIELGTLATVLNATDDRAGDAVAALANRIAALADIGAEQQLLENAAAGETATFFFYLQV